MYVRYDVCYFKYCTDWYDDRSNLVLRVVVREQPNLQEVAQEL